MPWLLRTEEMGTCVDVCAGDEPATGLLMPREPGDFVVAPLGTGVNNSRHKNASLLEPLGPAERITPED